MKKVVVLTPHDVRYGFTLAGADQKPASPAEAEELLKAVIADPDTGVVVIDERLLAGMDEERFREMEKRWYGIMVVMPAPATGDGAAQEDYALRLIRRAIGYHVRLQP